MEFVCYLKKNMYSTMPSALEHMTSDINYDTVAGYEACAGKSWTYVLYIFMYNVSTISVHIKAKTNVKIYLWEMPM